MVVAQAARNGSAPGKIFRDKGAHHVVLEARLLVDNVVRNTKFFGHVTGIVHIIDGTAAPLHCLGHAFVTGQSSLVPELQGEANDLVAAFTEHGRNGRRIDTARHGYSNGLVFVIQIQQILVNLNCFGRGYCHYAYELATFLYTGLRSRNRVTPSGINCSAKSILSTVFCLPRLKRRLALARSGDNPIAVKTCDGSIAPDEQAAPVETDRPLRSSAITMASPSRQSNTMFVVFGTRGAPALFTLTWSMISRMVRSSRSRSAVMRSTLPSANPSRAISAALPSPTMPARFSVPARRDRSWRPPYIIGCSKVPLRTNSAPAPCGPCILWPVTVSRSQPICFTSSGTLPAACTASVWKYTSASLAILPISLTGCSTPVSLFARIMLMSLVAGRNARRTSSGSTSARPSTGKEVTTQPISSSRLLAASTA